MSEISIRNLHKRYGAVETLKNVSVDIRDREFAVIVGPSGCGKSTLLRSIAGLEGISSGTITIGDRDVTHVDASDRGVAMVFQSYALYPHMTVRANMSFSLRMQGVARADIDRRVQEAAQILKLESLLDRKPRALSGGQRQRVAIGRAIVRNPAVFLFDEPLSNLDAELRVVMRAELARLHRQLNTTMIYVTHDQVEAMTLADRIVVMRDGIVEQVGTADELYDDPDNLFVATFLGTPKANSLGCTVAGPGELRLSCGQSLALDRHEIPDDVATATIRPEHINRPDGPVKKLSLQGVVESVENLGGLFNLFVSIGNGETMVVQHRDRRPPVVGEAFEAIFAEEDLRFFDASGARVRLGPAFAAGPGVR
jgi:ABC-type sugar transport system ATPase subunit